MLCTLALQVIPLGYLFAGANISFQGYFRPWEGVGTPCWCPFAPGGGWRCPCAGFSPACLPRNVPFGLPSSGGGGGPDCCGAAFENVLQGKGAPLKSGEGIGRSVQGQLPCERVHLPGGRGSRARQVKVG